MTDTEGTPLISWGSKTSCRQDGDYGVSKPWISANNLNIFDFAVRSYGNCQVYRPGFTRQFRRESRLGA
jgi:hypothetical protein